MNLAIELTTRFVGFAILLQSIEYFMLRPSIIQVWSWEVVQKEFDQYPGFVKRFLSTFLIDDILKFHFFSRTLGAIGLLMAVDEPWMLAALWASSILIGVRFRGTFNGGSDVMTALSLFCLWGASAFESNVILRKGFTLYLVVQVTASYVVAGIAKLRNKDWRRGTALSRFMHSPNYGTHPSWPALLKNPALALLLSWGIILFECGFPLAFLSPQWCLMFLSIGTFFHFVNFFVLGLNRFFWSWIATYPVLFALSMR